MEPSKFIFVDGLRFCRDDRTGYYLNRKRQIRLHRYIWERANGPIPPGYEIHHKDFNKANNDLSNLQMLTESEHHRLHDEAMTEEQKQVRRERFIRNVGVEAMKWHKSEEGRQWHKLHTKNSLALALKARDLVCQNCGRVYQGNSYNKFCSNACKSAWRRKTGIDDITVTCHACGKEFKKNKYFVREIQRKNKPLFCSHSCATKWQIAHGLLPMGWHGYRKAEQPCHEQERLAI